MSHNRGCRIIEVRLYKDLTTSPIFILVVIFDPNVSTLVISDKTSMGIEWRTCSMPYTIIGISCTGQND
jgi:hypothetical protein